MANSAKELLEQKRAEQAALPEGGDNEARNVLNQLRGQQTQFSEAATLAQNTLTNPVGEPIREEAILGEIQRGLRDLPVDQQFSMLQQELENPLNPQRLREQARQRGVDVHTGAPAHLRAAAANLADDPAAANQAMDWLIRQEYDIPDGYPALGRDPQTGELMYPRRISAGDIEEGLAAPGDEGRIRWTLVNIPGLDLGDIAEYSVELPFDLAELGVAALTTKGAAAGASLLSTNARIVGTEAAASSFIQGMSVDVKKAMAKQIGIPDEIVEQVGLEEAIFRTLLTGGSTLGLSGFVAAYKKLANSKRFLEPEDVEVLLENVEASERALRRVEEVTGVQVRPSGDLVLGTPETLVFGADERRRVVGPRARDLAVADVRMRQQTARATRELLNSTVEGPVPVLPREGGVVAPRQGSDQLGADVQEVLSDVTDPGARGLAERQARVEANLRGEVDDISKFHAPGRMEAIQNVTYETVDAAAQAEKKSWNTFRELAEFNPETGTSGVQLVNRQDGPIAGALAELRVQAGNALDAQDRAFMEATIKRFEELQNPTLGLEELHRIQSNLKRDVRMAAEAQSRGSQTGFRAADLRRLDQAIDDAIFGEGSTFVRTSTGRPVPKVREDLVNAYSQARDATRHARNLTRSAIVNDITETTFITGGKKGETQFKMLPGQIKQRLLKPHDASGIYDIIEVTGNNAQTLSDIANELVIDFRNASLNADGSLRRGAMEQWLNDHQDHIAAVFGPEQSAKIDNIMRMESALTQLRGRASRLQNVMREQYGDIFKNAGSSLYPPALVESAMTSSNVTATQINNMMRDLGNIDPRLAQDVQASTAQWIAERVLKGDVPANVGAFNTVMRRYGAKLRPIMGTEYLRNFAAIRDVVNLEDLAKQAKGSKQIVQPQWLQLTRSLFGPLSRKQRFITAANRVLRQRSALKGLELLSDPRQLNKYVKLQNMKPGTVAYALALKDLGLTEIARETIPDFIGAEPVLDPEFLNDAGARALEAIQNQGE